MSWAIVRRKGNRIKVKYARTEWGSKRAMRELSQGEFDYVKRTKMK